MKITEGKLRQIIRRAIFESVGSRFEAWVEDDDATDYVGGDVVMACDPTGGKEELEFIISRLRELDALGGGVEKIYVTGFTN